MQVHIMTWNKYLNQQNIKPELAPTQLSWFSDDCLNSNRLQEHDTLIRIFVLVAYHHAEWLPKRYLESIQLFSKFLFWVQPFDNIKQTIE